MVVNGRRVGVLEFLEFLGFQVGVVSVVLVS